MITTPKNTALLELDKLYTDEIILEGGLKLYLDPSYRPEWNVTVTGKIAALPKAGIPGMRVGDQVYFSYHVVNDRTYESDKDFFVRTELGNEHFREYTDKKGGTIRIVAFPGVITKHWCGKYIDEFGEFVDGVQGSESDVERWLSQFKMGYARNLVYKNLLEIDMKDYWMAKKDMIFAIKRGKRLLAMPGYAICKPIVMDMTEMVNLSEGLSLPPMSIKATAEDRGRIVTIGDPLPGVKKISALEGDVVLFDHRLVEKYEFDGKQYFVVKHNRILAKE